MTTYRDPFMSGYDLTTPEGRGQALIKAHSRILNAGTFRVQDTVRDLIEHDLWRSYSYRARRFEWLGREFDYFVQAWMSSDDPVYEWSVLRRNIVDPELIMSIADRSGGPVDGVERRSLDELQAQLSGPSVANLKLVSDDERQAASDDVKRAKFLAGKSATTASRPGRQTWKIDYRDSTADQLADRIVTKLNEDPDLANEVYRKLHSRNVVNNRRKNAHLAGVPSKGAAAAQEETS